MSENKSNLIKVKAYFQTCIYPRGKVLGANGNNFGITVWEVSEVISGELFKNEITVKGEFYEPLTETLDLYTLLLKPIFDKKYGQQYELVYITRPINLETPKGLKGFLHSFLTNLQVENLLKTYNNPLPIMEAHDVEALKKVHGVGSYIAGKILERYDDNKDWSDVYFKLDGIGITQGIMRKLKSKYGNPQKIIDVVLHRPYALVYEVEGIGFLTADNIALKGGLSPKSPERVKAYIVYYLNQKAYDEGKSYVTASTLLMDIYAFFDGKENILEEIDGVSNISKAIKDLQDSHIIVVEESENKARRRVYLTKIYHLEEQIALNLKRLLNAPNKFYYGNWQDSVKHLEKIQGFDFDETQLNGIKLALDEQVCLISGLAGSGKSSLVSGVLAALRDSKKNFHFAQCALSGKAAARLHEVTGENGMTIHRLLGLKGYEDYSNIDEIVLPKLDGYDAIVVDEISLVGGELFLLLLKAINDGTKLIMLGDLGQLPSIGALNLAADFYNSPTIPTVELKTVHRQAAKSGIILASHQVRNQEQLFDKDYSGTFVVGEMKDMVLDIHETKDDMDIATMKWFIKCYEGELVQQDPLKIQVIAPVKTRGKCCVHNLNLMIQDYVNPLSALNNQNIITCNHYDIRKKDKVMCIRNNYNYNIFNGWVGIVEAITNTSIFIRFDLSDGIVEMGIEDVPSHLVLGYASTVHKLQGSDAPVVIGVVDFSTPPSMLDNALLYTLITRAKKRCILVGQNAAIRKAIATNHVSEKVTFMCELLE